MRLIFNELGVQFKRIAAVDGSKDVTKHFINANGIRMMEKYFDPKGSRPLTLGMYIICAIEVRLLLKSYL